MVSISISSPKPEPRKPTSSSSRQDQWGNPLRIGYLGPAGSFTEEAARSYSVDAELVSYPTIQTVATSVRADKVDLGIAPVENSLQGAVTDTLDVLIHSDSVSVFGELVLPINHTLLAAGNTTLSDIVEIYSHPQALAQCQQYLETKFPDATLRGALSTAAAVEDMLQHGKGAAAIASERASEIYGATILANTIQDAPSNATRFLVFSKHDHSRTGKDKTSICFSFGDDRPGLLYEVMKELTERNINLSKVESRPTREALGRYYFLMDLEGHRQDQAISEVLEFIGNQTVMLKVFGSYPQLI